MNSKKSLLPIVFSVALVGGLVSCSQDKTTEEYLNDAQTYLQQNKTAEAIISLKNVLKVDANDVQARFLLGKSYINQGNWLIAEKELSRAKKYNYDIELVYPLLAEAYSHLEDGIGIEQLLKDIADNKALEQTLRYFLAVTYIYEGEEILALGELDNVVGLDVDSVYGQLGQAWLYTLRKQFDEAIGVVDKLINSDGYESIVLDLKAKTYFTANNMELAANSLKDYLQLRPLDNQSRLMYAMALAASSNLAEAEKQADLFLTISPNNPLINMVKAQSRLVAEDYAGAKQFAEVALKNKGDLTGAAIIAGYSYYKLGQPERAYSHLKKIKNQLSLLHPARRLLTAISIELGYIDESYEDIENATDGELDASFLSLSSSQLFKQGDVDKAANVLDKAQQLEPLNGQLAYQQGLLKMSVNDPESIRFFEQAIKSNPESEQVISLLIMEHLKQKNFDEALKVARSTLDSNFVLSKTLEGVTYKMQGEYALAENAFNDILSKDQENILALFNLGNIAESKNDIATAIKLYLKVLTVDTSNAPTINAIYRIGKTDEHKALVNEKLTELVKNSEYSPNESLILLGFYMRDEKVAEATSVLTQSLDKNPESFPLRIVEARLLAFEDKGELALKKLDQLLISSPNALQARKLKIAILNARKQNFDTVQEQELIVKMGLGGNNEVLNLVFLYIQNNNLEKANQLFSKLPDMSNISPKYEVIKGKLAFMKENFTQAIHYLKPAYERIPSAPILIDLVQAMQNTNQADEALALIVGFEKNNELTIELILKQAELYTEKEPDKALAIYERLAKKTNEHYVVLNNIAYVLLVQKKLPEALSYSKKALSKAENVPAVINTYGLIQLEAGNVSEAVQYLHKAYKANINNQNYLVHYIQALFVDKQYSLVESLLLKVDKNMLSSESLARLAIVQSK